MMAESTDKRLTRPIKSDTSFRKELFIVSWCVAVCFGLIAIVAYANKHWLGEIALVLCIAYIAVPILHTLTFAVGKENPKEMRGGSLFLNIILLILFFLSVGIPLILATAMLMAYHEAREGRRP